MESKFKFPKVNKKRRRKSSSGRSNKRVLLSIAKLKCEACGKNSELDYHHILSKGAGGADVEENILVLCRKHHIEIHSQGIKKFAEQNQAVEQTLIKKGWQINEVRGTWARFGGLP